jgi:hypothetical protein
MRPSLRRYERPRLVRNVIELDAGEATVNLYAEAQAAIESLVSAAAPVTA